MTRSRILIVEDEVIVANNLKRRLEELDYDIPAIVFSGKDAIQKAGEVQLDLVLIDIKLEGAMDGVESAQKIRERFDIPVIYLTGYSDTSTLERAKITEPYGYILKPFEIRELHSTIEMALYKHRMERRLRESERRYRSLVEHSLQGLMVVQGVPPRVVFANTPCEEITGYSVDELLALTPDEAVSLVYPDDREFLLAMLSAHLANQPIPSTGEFRVVRSDGAVRWVEYFASLVQHSGAPAVQAAFVDITDRRHAQEALRRAHDDLEQRVKARTAELAEANTLLRREIANRRVVEERLAQRVEELRVLNTMAKRVGASLSLDRVVEAALETLVHSVAPDLTMLYLRQGNELTLLDAQPSNREFELRLPDVKRVGQCLCGLAASEGSAKYSSNIHSDARCTLDECKAVGMQSFAAMPLRSGDEILGVLGLASVAEQDFSLRSAFLEALAGDVAMGLQNALLYQQVQTHAAELEQEVLERKRVEDELTRTNTLLSALNEMSVSLQSTLNPREVLEALGLELRTLDLACVVALLEPDVQELVVHYASIEPEALASLEAMVGSSLQDYRLSGKAQPIQRLVGQERALYIPDPIAVLSAQFPSHSLEFLNRAIQIAGIAPDSSAIYLPMSVKDRMIGGMAVWGTSLREEDLPALSIFASQVAIAFERVRLTQEAAEAEILRELDRLRSELIANVSHEIRTPLGLIEVSCTSLLMEDVEFDQETQRAFLHGIKEETERLKAIVENLLNLGRMESGRWQLHRRETDLGQLASEVMAGLEVYSDQHRFVHDFPPAGLLAMVDRRQIEQVLRNLLSNAIRYSPGGGVITVHGHRDGRRVVISVTDEGVGIPIEEQERIFERFYRVESELTHKVSGVGLGLAVCRGIVESHGGRIWVESIPGQGSSFHISIPLGSWASEPDSTQTGSQAAAPHLIQSGDTV